MFLKNVCNIEFKVVLDENEYDTFIFHTFEDARRFCHAYYYKDDKIKRLDIDLVLCRYDKEEDSVIESFYYTREDWNRDVENASNRIRNMLELRSKH